MIILQHLTLKLIIQYEKHWHKELFYESGETDLRAWPAVSIAGPQQSDQVQAEESAQQCQHHVVLRHGSKQLCRARYVHVVRHHNDGAPKESEVVTQTLRLLWGALLSHLRQTDHISVWYAATGAGGCSSSSSSCHTCNIRVNPGGNSPGSLQCSMSPSLCSSTSTCWQRKWSSASGLSPKWNWRVWCQRTRLQESAVTCLGLSSSDSLLLQKLA